MSLTLVIIFCRLAHAFWSLSVLQPNVLRVALTLQILVSSVLLQQRSQVAATVLDTAHKPLAVQSDGRHAGGRRLLEGQGPRPSSSRRSEGLLATTEEVGQRAFHKSARRRD